MSQKTKNQAAQDEINELKLRNAFRLIKQERYGAARQILRELPEHPKALKMLAMMEGKTEKRKAKSAIGGWALFITLFVIIALGGVIGGAFLFDKFVSSFTLDELARQAAMGDGSYGSITALINYCSISTNYERNKCLQWPIQVMDEYSEAFETCFSPYAETTVLQDSQVQAIRNCLNSYNVPAPY